MAFRRNIKDFIGIVMLALLIGSCAVNGAVMRDTSTKNTSLNINAESSAKCKIVPSKNKVKAVAILVHGLNLKPSRMDDWTKLLADHGTIVIRPELFGHNGVTQDMLSVHEDKWRNDIDQAVKKASAIARIHHVPMIFLGYSLGGLLGLEWVSKQKKNVFDKMVLIAPAIAIPWYGAPALRVVDFFDVNFMVMSPCPKAFKANQGSSVNAYRALLSLKNSLENNKYNNANIDTLILVDKNDELISSEGIKQIISDHKLGRWQVELVNNDFGRRNHGFRHLMIDKDSVGEALWKTISERALKHFGLISVR